MISAETPGLFAKACEMFIIELTYRAWFYTEENKRRTLQKSDVAMAVVKTDILDFLVSVLPKGSLEVQPKDSVLTYLKE
jgi:nuclear transcription factor Y gamma